MTGGEGGMSDGLEDTASFASLTNWGKSWRDMERRMRKRMVAAEFRLEIKLDKIYSTCWVWLGTGQDEGTVYSYHRSYIIHRHHSRCSI